MFIESDQRHLPELFLFCQGRIRDTAAGQIVLNAKCVNDLLNVCDYAISSACVKV